MAREGSEQLAGATTNANAAIAEMVQKGRLAMTPELARLASGKNDLMNQVALQNQSNQLKANESRTGLLSGLNTAIGNQQGAKTDALKGMTSLYGTTPALVNTYGSLSQGQQQINNNHANNRSRNRISMLSNSMRG
jgi:hypothetical protein